MWLQMWNKQPYRMMWLPKVKQRCGCHKWIKQPHRVMWLPKVSRLDPGTAQVKTIVKTSNHIERYDIEWCDYQKWSKQPYRMMWLPKVKQRCGCHEWIKQPHRMMWLPKMSQLDPGTAQVKTSNHIERYDYKCETTMWLSHVKNVVCHQCYLR